MSRVLALTVGVVALMTLLPAVGRAADPAPEKVPILLDTDIGSDVDDVFALALALASPEVELVGVTTVGAGAEDRAWMVCRFLTAVGRREVPVAWGRDPQPKSPIDGQIQYRRHPAVIFNRTAKPVKESAVELLYAKLKERPGKLTIVAIGPLTNIARLLKEHPDCKPWIKRVVLMGGSVRIGYEGKEAPEAEWNIKSDIPAAQAVFTSGLPLLVAPLDATADLRLEEPPRRKLFAACTPLTLQVQALYQLWDKPTPVLFDPAAVALSFLEERGESDRFFATQGMPLEVDDKGFTRIGKGNKPTARVAMANQRERFLTWYVERVAAGKAVPPKAPGNESKLIERTGLPNRVHCFEDYETDIEKRWWMSGKVETKDVPPGSKRACRGVLTQDFDDLQGDTNAMYTAVIFNPVPGPPMGKNPRLSFRYKLKGTDTLRVQVYSLSNGYHRYLSLKGLPQDKWESATVDMTQARRADGGGGPLSEGERIDDVQFYVDPRAELLIDDMVLYDAAAPGEKRLFPKNFLYTGWFDTGKQGQEWPGAFEIAPKQGYFQKAAKSVDNPDLGGPSIRLHLRGQRPAGEKTQLFFRYRLTGAESLQVRLANRTTKETPSVELTNLKTGEWAEATADFPSGLKRGDRVDEIQFVLPKGAELLVDDVLLYEPGEKAP
jgi:inosine-uridine nucleoside N-ribohydrolase